MFAGTELRVEPKNVVTVSLDEILFPTDIISTTDGLTGLKRLLMGRVAERVVRRATAPVLTVEVNATASPGAPR